jgi:GNAT superfamily N-acetyltransferase
MNNQQFSIRRAEQNDIAELRALIERSVRHLQKHDYTPAQIEGALGHALGLDTQLVEDGTYFVATAVSSPGVIVGSGGWSFRRTLFGSDQGPDREKGLLDPATEPAKIRAIFVDPAWSRQGLGTLLLKHCEDAAQQAGFSHLEMGSTLTGVPLYTLKGYEWLARVEVPLPNGEVLPIVRMVKAL